MRKVAAILGFVLSGIVFMTGILTMSGAIDSLDFDGDTANYVFFASDYSNYSYRATSYAANNVAELGELVQQVSGLAMLFVGAAGVLISLYGLGAAQASKRQCRLLEAILSTRETVVETPVPEIPKRAPVAPPQRKYPEDKPMRIPVTLVQAKTIEEKPAWAGATPDGNGWYCLCGATNPNHAAQCLECGADKPREALKKKGRYNRT